MSERLNSAQASSKQPIPSASKDADGERDLGALLVHHGGEKYGFCRGKFLLDAPAGCDVIACSALCEADCFNSIIDRYGAKFLPADRRAIVSLWTLYYFSILTINTALAWLELRRCLPVSLDEVSLCLDRETATPVSFLLPNLGQVRELDIHAAIRPLVRQHIEPLANAISHHAHLSGKLLWGNAAGYLDWIIDETGRQSAPALAEEGAPLFSDPTFPDGEKNPLCGTLRSMQDESGLPFKRRKVCCLRYCLPDIGGCGLSCPLPQGRQ
ncbi:MULTISPECIES: siderophore-iron reductase FhuF [unclassified Rhizobium]|uniref:siderophore-iron reductase FhuF n=1 Tax=unclassified Rhizobium TaxID=2613769 RepID=UPI000CDF5114|nr:MULTISPECIES: siderophore-iron reductase FhuF [Rhizobium]AVA24963.1 ferric iron reductase FhuF-like transporter protein [Rhizobium sp. NXC24]MDK4741434.1 siderophore-iron reductase FhuF [Rhizobium sp. CNPSo 3464]UWU24744.1 siderophore-iron reductase FhuF [Rhizobium tropici]